jgi:hypothetical protein
MVSPPALSLRPPLGTPPVTHPPGRSQGAAATGAPAEVPVRHRPSPWGWVKGWPERPPAQQKASANTPTRLARAWPTSIRRPRRGATVVAKVRRAGPFAAVPRRPLGPLSSGYTLPRTNMNPHQPPWQCGGQGLESPQLHPVEQAVLHPEDGLTRLWLQLWGSWPDYTGQQGARPVGGLAGERGHHMAVDAHRRAHGPSRRCRISLCPWRFGAISALVLINHQHGRTT